MTYIPQRRRDDSFYGSLLVFFKRFFIVIGVSATISLVSFTLIAVRAVYGSSPALPESMILTYTFKSGLVETVSRPTFSQPLLRPATTFHEIIDGLTQAAKDKRVKGFIARLQDIQMAPAQIQELRDTLAKFRAAGKFAYIYADDFGGFAPGMGDYYLAAAFGQIWLQPVGAVSVNGIAAEVPFLKGILDKAGVEAEFSHKGIYKSASESLTETGMSAPHREMMTGLVNDLASQMIAGIAADRAMTPETLRQLVNEAPYSDDEALKLRLVDRVGYYDDMLEEAKLKAGGKDTETVKLTSYSFKADKPELDMKKDKAKIALIFGEGDIVPYASQAHAGLSGGDMAADKIAEAFGDAQKDKDVAAVVFRVDSPGGSPGAAETIRHAIVAAQHKGKPVIISMGGYAASGGYWLATPADKIVAEPATITGSIGVFGGKFVLAQLWEKLGVNWDSVQVGDNARMWSSNAAFSNQQRARFEFLMDKIYEAFITRVMEGRKMTRQQVVAVAEGHVWTGRQAKEKGLVDELGGLDKAITLAKVAAKLKPDQDIPVERFPGRKSALELFIRLAMEGTSIMPAVHISTEDIFESLQAALSGADVLKSQKIELYQ
jgi:protease-4